MRTFAVAVALALAAATPASARGVTWADQPGDANATGEPAAASVAAFDITSTTLAPYRVARRTSGLSIRVTMLGDAVAFPAEAAVVLDADEGDCHVTVQWSASLLEGDRDEVTRSCPNGADFVPIHAYLQGRTVVMDVPPDALPDPRVGARLANVVVATTYSDPVVAFAPTITPYDTSRLLDEYVLGR